MSSEWVRSHYGVDYKVGDRLTVDGRPGVLVSFPNQYLGVRFDGERHTSRAHPTWRVEREDPTPERPEVESEDGAGMTLRAVARAQRGPRCGECRLGLGVHEPRDPQCTQHRPATTTEENA